MARKSDMYVCVYRSMRLWDPRSGTYQVQPSSAYAKITFRTVTRKILWIAKRSVL